MPPYCVRAQSLRNTALCGDKSEDRLRLALEAPCTCGMGDDDGERTSIIKAARVQAIEDQKALEEQRLIKGKSDIE